MTRYITTVWCSIMIGLSCECVAKTPKIWYRFPSHGNERREIQHEPPLQFVLPWPWCLGSVSIRPPHELARVDWFITNQVRLFNRSLSIDWNWIGFDARSSAPSAAWSGAERAYRTCYRLPFTVNYQSASDAHHYYADFCWVFLFLFFEFFRRFSLPTFAGNKSLESDSNWRVATSHG